MYYKKKTSTHQNVFPLPTVRVLSASNSPSWINSTAGGGQICTTLCQGRRLLQVLCQCLEPKMLGDGAQQVGEGGTHPGQHHEELQEEEEGSVRDVQGRGCVHHQEHPHWPGLVLENKLHSHCSVSSLARLSTSISSSTRQNTGWVALTKRLGTLLGLDSASVSLGTFARFGFSFD